MGAEELIERLREAREQTFAIYDWAAAEDDLRRRPGPGFRPLLWHLGHLGAFEEWWLLMRLRQQEALLPRYQVVFDPIQTPREESENLPPRAEIEDYLSRVRARVIAGLRAPAGEPGDDYFYHLVLEHELQHQETLTYLLQMLDPERKRRPAVAMPEVRANGVPGGMVKVPGGSFVMGVIGSRGYPFAYDNEGPPHEVELPEFRLDRLPVTNAEYAVFVERGGYRNRALWSADGWAWKEENQVARPHYWSDGPPWEAQEMFARGPLGANLPVTGVSWHEAEAYSRFVGKRLPTEAEWEKAGAWDAAGQRKLRFPWGDDLPDAGRCNSDGRYLGPSPVGAFPRGASPYGCLDMAGNVWEWTASAFAPYPGFAAYPYPEYSEIWFDGDHRVLKGGSWMTRGPLLRTSFRNFFRRGFRHAFAGFRCATD